MMAETTKMKEGLSRIQEAMKKNLLCCPTFQYYLMMGILSMWIPEGRGEGEAPRRPLMSSPSQARAPKSYPKPRFLRSHLCPPWRRLTINTFQLTSGPPKV